MRKEFSVHINDEVKRTDGEVWVVKGLNLTNHNLQLQLKGRGSHLTVPPPHESITELIHCPHK